VEVAVGAVEPVLPRRVEDVHVQRVLERERLVRNVGRDVQHLAGAHDHLLRPVRTDPELERAFEDVGELLVVVRVLRHERVLLQVDVREHHPVPRDEPPRDHVGDALLREVLPVEVAYAGGGLVGHETRDEG
jgi:hypothetical protein